MDGVVSCDNLGFRVLALIIGCTVTKPCKPSEHHTQIRLVELLSRMLSLCVLCWHHRVVTPNLPVNMDLSTHCFCISVGPHVITTITVLGFTSHTCQCRGPIVLSSSLIIDLICVSSILRCVFICVLSPLCVNLFCYSCSLHSCT